MKLAYVIDDRGQMRRELCLAVEAQATSTDTTTDAAQRVGFILLVQEMIDSGYSVDQLAMLLTIANDMQMAGA